LISMSFLAMFTTSGWHITGPARKYKISTDNAPFRCYKKISTGTVINNIHYRTGCGKESG
ncbi:hypothetical protein, partial [Escherichia coli]|uniref:hypothetical protein n=1 Tax=Escherichia coli TaxID=562 RepID=UPI001BC86A94